VDAAHGRGCALGRLAHEGGNMRIRDALCLLKMSWLRGARRPASAGVTICGNMVRHRTWTVWTMGIEQTGASL